LLRAIVSSSLFVVLAVATLGQLVRDRSLALMFTMFVPLLPMALIALLWDVVLLVRARGQRVDLSLPY
jgi:hypothetical protein